MNTSAKTELAAPIGLDWADQKHDLWLCPTEGQPEHLVLEQTPEAIPEWVARWRQRFATGQIAVGLETSRGAIVYALMAYDFLVLYPINPKAWASYRESFKVSGAKDGRTAAVNQCQSQFKCYYPLARDILGDLTSTLAADFLLKGPDLAALKKAGAAKMRRFFYAHNSRSEALMQQREAALEKARPLTEDLAIITPARMMVEALAALIKSLNQVIARMDETIAQLMDQHADAEVFRSFPSAGPVLAPRLLVAFGTGRHRFRDALEVAQLYGIAPVKRASGKTQVIVRHWRCPKFGRQSFHEQAACVVKTEPWAREYYQMQRNLGKSHHAAIRATAFKLIRIYYSCWKNRTKYNADTYLAALKKHGSPLLSKLASNEKSTAQ